ncbi:MAG: acyl-CoA dehydrogenase [Rhodospirillales bacterium]|nr:acyl-CoA dehydrogenase [Rhodospirillales bacterium]
MKLRFGDEAEAFRSEVRAFFDREYPADLIAKLRDGQLPSREDHIRAQKALQSRGWLAVNWPKEFGGTGWDATRRYIFEEELDRAGALTLLPMAIIYVGPVIIAFGNAEQQREWLPEILESRALWAQGYSEPEAGSDLAALSLTAERDGDEYVLNGEKTWTSYAQWADWIFCLVRTSREARRQDGISFVCVRMSTPGVAVHPVVTLDGVHHLNRVSFNNVRVPVSQRIGEEGQGWRYATFLLQNERVSYAHVSRKKEDLRALRALATASEGGRYPRLIDDPIFSLRLAECEIAVDVLEVSVFRVLVAGSDVAPAEASTLKVFATETAQLISELFTEAAGRSGAVFIRRDRPGWNTAAPLIPAFAVHWMAQYLFDRAQTIYGGATEVQKNIIWRMIGR